MGNKNNTENQTYEYSALIKKGLLIGINYIGVDDISPLNGCINDSENLAGFLHKNKYIPYQEMTLMNDKQSGNLYPTKKNIVKQLKYIVECVEQYPQKPIFIFFSYSGHGYYQADDDGDEFDGRDEVLCPVDCMSNGFIRDDDLKEQFIDKLPPNVTCVILIDSCHSGTILDLKYEYPLGNNLPVKIHNHINDTQCNVVMISGCTDSQTSGDANLKDTMTSNYEYQGAMTASFLNTFHDEITYAELITNMRKLLKDSHFTQIPQLSSGKYIDVTKPCLLSQFND